jgi:hypothetical protein
LSLRKKRRIRITKEEPLCLEYYKQNEEKNSKKSVFMPKAKGPVIITSGGETEEKMVGSS